MATEEGPALWPDLPIFDAHHHLWDRPGQTYLIDDFIADIAASGHKIVRTALVESGSFTLLADGNQQAIDEARDGAASAHRAAALSRGLVNACATIVGHIDLRLGDGVNPWLDELVEATGGRLRAIRHCGVWDASEVVRGGPPLAPPRLFDDPGFHAGLAAVQARGLAFDCWAYQTQHDEVIGLARAFPDLPMVFNHGGGVLGIGPYAGRRDELHAAWRAGMARLAELPNMWMKLGGLGMKRSGFAFFERPERPSGQELADGWRPWIEPAIDLFGARRCMFESNFPVDRASCSYRQLWNGFKIIAEGASSHERAALFHDSAFAFYEG